MIGRRCAVLMAAYNGQRFIDQQIASILDQEQVDITLFISVDLSSDLTYEKCITWAESHDNVILLSYGERFGSAALNFFRLIREVDISEFDLVAFSDQDDIWERSKIAAAHAVLKTGEFDAYSCNVIAFWSSGDERLVQKAYPVKKFDHLFESAGPGCTYVFTQRSFASLQTKVSSRRDLCERIELHDWLAYALTRESNYSWYIDKVPYLRYRQHDSNVFGANMSYRAFWRRFQLIRSGWYREQTGAIAELASNGTAEEIKKRSFFVCNFFELRRRPRDRLVLLIMAILGLY